MLDLNFLKSVSLMAQRHDSTREAHEGEDTGHEFFYRF